MGNRTPTTVELADADMVSSDKPMYFFSNVTLMPNPLEFAAFIDAVSSRQPLTVTAHDGPQALVLAEAAAKSLHAGRPVKIGPIK